MTKIPTRRVVSQVTTFIVICLVLLLFDRLSWLDPVRDGLGEVLSPVSEAFESIGQPGTGGSSLEVAYATAVAERNRLASENAQLTAELEDVEILREQNRAAQQRPDITYVGAKVIGRDPSGTEQMIIINRGTADGLREGMAVVNPDIYVGQITSVDQHQAKVQLISDSHASVGAMLNDHRDERADGVIYGTRSGMLVMRHVDKDVKPEELEWIVTSALADSETAQVPPNIPIGVVVGEPKLDARGDQLELTVQPGTDLNDLTNVWIAVPNE